MAEEKLKPIIKEATSQVFSCDGARPVTVIMYAQAGLTVGSEYGHIQISHDGGWTFQDFLVGDPGQQRLHGGNVSMTIYGPGVFRVHKETTSNAAGIYISKNTSP